MRQVLFGRMPCGALLVHAVFGKAQPVCGYLRGADQIQPS